jgi:hypothetical protein
VTQCTLRTLFSVSSPGVEVRTACA